MMSNVTMIVNNHVMVSHTKSHQTNLKNQIHQIHIQNLRAGIGRPLFSSLVHYIKISAALSQHRNVDQNPKGWCENICTATSADYWKIMGAFWSFLEEFNEQIIPAPKKTTAKKAPSSDASRVLRSAQVLASRPPSPPSPSNVFFGAFWTSVNSPKIEKRYSKLT